MELLTQVVDMFLHLDKHLDRIIEIYGTGAYLILFAIIFVETGLVIMPFLPGDSLLFAAGIFAARGSLSYPVLALVLISAALLGDNANYWIGKLIGKRLFANERSRLFRREHLERTHAFFERYGGKTIIIARFVPIVRTFAPFVAGVGAMTYRRFIGYSVFAACLWVGVCVTAGYLFGGLPIVRDNFSVAVLGVIAVSLIPAIIEIAKARRSRRQQSGAVADAE